MRQRRKTWPLTCECVCVRVKCAGLFQRWPEAGFVSSIRARGPQPETWPEIANECLRAIS